MKIFKAAFYFNLLQYKFHDHMTNYNKENQKKIQNILKYFHYNS